jgi:hypothetical protein
MPDSGDGRPSSAVANQFSGSRLAAVVFLIESHFTGRSALDSVTGKFGDAVAQ